MNTHFKRYAPALLLAVVAITAVVALGGFAPDAAIAGVLLANGALALTMEDAKALKDAIENQGKAWDEFKKTNDELLKAKAEGKSVTDLVAKLDKINTDFSEMTKQLNAIEAKANRPKPGSGELTPEQQEHKQAFGRFLRKGDVNGLEDLQRKAMNSGSDQDGGYLVTPEMDMAIDRIAPTISAMYRLADTVTIGTQKWEKLVKTSGMTMRRVAVGAAGGETTEPKFDKLAIEVYTAEVEPWIYNETLEDARIDLEMDLADEAAIGFAEGAGSEFISGDGVGKARGITKYTNIINSSYAWGKVGYIASGKSAAFASVAPADKVIDLQHALKAQYRPGAVFLTTDTTLGVMRQIKDASGSYYLWQPDPAAAFGGRFLGHPVEIDDNMPVIAAGSYSLAFGNFKRGYKIVNRAGTSVIRDNITAKGTTKFNFRRRFGGGIVHFEAIKLMKFATS